jgi:hypothetical protein
VRGRVVAAPLAAAARAAAGSTHSGGRARRARDHTARSAPPGPRRPGGLVHDSMLHGLTPPCRASAPPRSSTARAVSVRSELVSRSCPLRAVGSVPSAPASAPAVPGSTPRPSVSARRRGWLAGAPCAGARPRTRHSSLRPTRTARTRRAPARTHDTDRIDRPRAAPARSGWTRTHNRRTLPRGSARPRARREGSGGQTRAFTFSILPIYFSGARCSACMGPPTPATLLPKSSTAPHKFSVSPPRPPLGPPAPVEVARATGSAVTTTMLKISPEKILRSTSSPPVLTVTTLRDHSDRTSSESSGTRRSSTPRRR